MTERTAKAQAFFEANEKSPVVFGSAKGKTKGGGYYRLADGSTWTLTLAECQSLPLPRWDL